MASVSHVTVITVTAGISSRGRQLQVSRSPVSGTDSNSMIASAGAQDAAAAHAAGPGPAGLGPGGPAQAGPEIRV